MRTSEISRVTAETDITLTLDLDGRGASDIDTGVGFLDHMLTLLAKHARFDLSVNAKGDNYVDDHHTVEDVGIALGQAFAEAVGDKRGICRYGDSIVPMDEALILTAIDISGRPHLSFELKIPSEKILAGICQKCRRDTPHQTACRNQLASHHRGSVQIRRAHAEAGRIAGSRFCR